MKPRKFLPAKVSDIKVVLQFKSFFVLERLWDK